jgi:hypothetical protein
MRPHRTRAGDLTGAGGGLSVLQAGNEPVKGVVMSRTLILGVAAALGILCYSTGLVLADEVKTITGNGMCAKCMLNQGTECQTVIQVKDGDKTLTYYLTKNDVSKKFHSNVCEEAKKVTATGTVKEVDGKLELTATKIELVK